MSESKSLADALRVIHTSSGDASDGEFRAPDPEAVARVERKRAWIDANYDSLRHEARALAAEGDGQTRIDAFVLALRHDGFDEWARALWASGEFVGASRAMVDALRGVSGELDVLSNLLHPGAYAIASRMVELDEGRATDFLLDAWPGGLSLERVAARDDPRAAAEVVSRLWDAREWALPQLLARVDSSARTGLLQHALVSDDRVRAGWVAASLVQGYREECDLEGIPALLSSAVEASGLNWEWDLHLPRFRTFLRLSDELASHSTTAHTPWVDAAIRAVGAGGRPLFDMNPWADDARVAFAALSSADRDRMVAAWPPTEAFACALFAAIGLDSRSVRDMEWARPGCARLSDVQLAAGFLSCWPLAYGGLPRRKVPLFVVGLRRPRLRELIVEGLSPVHERAARWFLNPTRSFRS